MFYYTIVTCEWSKKKKLNCRHLKKKSPSLDEEGRLAKGTFIPSEFGILRPAVIVTESLKWED